MAALARCLDAARTQRIPPAGARGVGVAAAVPDSLAGDVAGEETWARHMRMIGFLVLFLALAAGCTAPVLFRR